MQNLPNGRKFNLWKDKTNYQRVFHVAKKHPTANDTNDGSEDAPFLTIQKAAEIAEAGDMVLIHEGEYHETIRPRGTGKSESEMLCFKGADGEKVSVTGAEIFPGPYKQSEDWKRSHSQKEDNAFTDADAKVFLAKLPHEAFIGSNPLSKPNGPYSGWWGGSDFTAAFAEYKQPARKLILMRRGMMFCDGKRLMQVANYFELGDGPGRFFVEDDGLNVHLRLPNNAHPDDHCIEFTAREQCFIPKEKYSSFIKVENITFSKVGNGFPPPQCGAVSTNCGHHFIINNCRVEDANSVGIDIGFQSPARFSNQSRGHHIVSNCVISRCGMLGLCGTPGSSDAMRYIDMQHGAIIVVGNQFFDNCWHDIEQMCESAAIKLHHIRDSLIVNNYINTTSYGNGIWVDASCENVAIRENSIINVTSYYGGIFVEASHDDIEISSNIIVKSKCRESEKSTVVADGAIVGIQKNLQGGNGIYSHSCDNILNQSNIILGCEGYGIMHRYSGAASRINRGRGCMGYGFKFYKNIIADCHYALLQPTEKGDAENNIYGKFPKGGYLQVGFPQAGTTAGLYLDLKAWREYLGWDKNGLAVNIDYAIEAGDIKLKLSIQTDEKNIRYMLNLSQPLAVQIEELMTQIKTTFKEN